MQMLMKDQLLLTIVRVRPIRFSPLYFCYFFVGVLRKVFDPLHRQFPAPKILVVDEQSARDLGDSIAVFELAQSGIVRLH